MRATSPLKVCVANNYYYLRGGSERVMFDEAGWLQGKGYEIIPFSRKHPQNVKSSYAKYFLPITEFDAIGGMEKVHAAANIVYSKPMRQALGKMLDQAKPQLVHGHNIYGGLSYSIVDAAKERRIPFVLTLHDLKLACPSYLMLNRGEICERCGSGAFWNCAAQRCHKESLAASLVNTAEAYYNKLFKKYDWISRFLCPSRFLLEKIARVGIPREKLVYLPNALDPEAYEPHVEPGKYVLFAGRLSQEKGASTLLKAFEGLDIPLRIAGTGPLEEELKVYAESKGMKHVTFEGYCRGDKLKELFQNTAFLVVPSECYENAPMSILEAFAYGKPVIGSNLGGVPEQVLQDETGVLFEAGNPEDLAIAVSALWASPDKIESMGRAARRRIENEYCAKQHTEKLLGIYNEII